MIEAIREIGGKILEDDSEKLLENFILEIPAEIKGRKLHLIIIDFKIFDKNIEIDFEEIKEDTSKKYLWVGNADAANSPQIYFTTNNLSWILSQTIPNQILELPSNTELSKLLHLCLKEMFIDLKCTVRERYLLNWNKIKVLGERIDIFDKTNNLKKEYENYTKSSDKEKKKDKNISKKLLNAIDAKVWELIKTKKQFTKKDISLFTLKINGRFMIEEDEYRKVIVKKKIDSLFDNSNQKTCSCCNKNKPFTDSPRFAKAKSALGAYITDKVGFSSNLSGKFTKNFIICKDCYKKLLIGEIFARNKLYTRLGGLDLYIIPQFLLPVELGSNKLSAWAEYITDSFNSAKSFQQLKAFEGKLDQYREFEAGKNNFIVNLLFWKKGTGAETKILKLIKDVPPTRLYLLRRTTNEIKDTSDKLLGDTNQWIIDLQNIYYLIPLRKSQTEIEYRKILALYDAIFSGKPVSYSFLIDQFVELAQVYKFKRAESYNVTANARKENWDENKWSTKLVYSLLQSNLFLLYLRKLNLLRKGGNMDYDSLQLNEGIKAFIKEMKYDEAKTALFLLGYLIGEIGNAQYKLTDSHTKPILNKVNFEGINPDKLIRLTNEVSKKMNQYRVFSSKDKSRVPLLVFNQGIFNEYKKLIDKELTNWQPSDHENVFYILSGYAYATNQTIMEASRKVSKDQTKKEGKGNEQQSNQQ